MLTKATIENLDATDLKLLTEEDVLAPKVVTRLEELLNDGEFEQESGESIELFDAVNELIAKHEKTIIRNKELYSRYVKILWGLRWKALSSLSSEDQENMFRNNLLFSLRQGFSVKTWTMGMVRKTEFGTYPDGKKRQMLFSALENNTEHIGNNGIELTGGKNIVPSVQNWIKDYETSLQRHKNKTQSLKDYIDQNVNVQKLEADNQKKLEQVLELFTWLKYPQISGEFIAAKEAEQEIKKMRSERKTQPVNSTHQVLQQQNISKNKTTKQGFDTSQISKRTKELMENHNLHIDEGEDLNREIIRAVNGHTAPDEFTQRLRTTLPRLQSEELTTLVKDIDDKIFKPFRNELVEKTQETNIEKKLTQTVRTPAQRTDVTQQHDPYREPIE